MTSTVPARRVIEQTTELLTYSNLKTKKGEKSGYLTAVLNLAPAELSGHNVCPSSTPGCRRACLNTCWNSDNEPAQAIRIRKTKWFFEDRPGFFRQLQKDLEKLVRTAKQKGMKPVCRLNGTSDIAWEIVAPWIFTEFWMVMFVDYTKRPGRYRRFLDRDFPRIYHLCFSRSELNEYLCLSFLEDPRATIAQVFKLKEDEPPPKMWQGYRVIDGTEHDLRHLDPHGVIVGLRALRRAKTDETGFVVDA